MKLNYVVRASKVRKNGLCPIELSIIINSERKVITLDRQINPSHWNPKSQTVKNNKEINTYLQSITQKLYTLQTELLKHNIPLTIENLLDAYKNGIQPHSTIITLFQKHNKEYYKTKILTKTCTKDTYLKYEKTLQYLKQYLQQVYNKKDIALNKITPQFIDGFFSFLLQHMQNNSAIKTIKKLKTILSIAIDEGYIQTNPFRLKLKEETVFHNPLTTTDIEKIKSYLRGNFSIRISNVGYCFLFQCYTGLAYIDMKNLTRDNIKDNTIIINRQKTNVQSIIPLLPQALEILEMYDYKLPVLSNQKYNSYLKEIQDICGITKPIHSHIARHTFATQLINNNVPLPVIARALGHSNTRITEKTYAKLNQDTVYQEIMKLKDVI